MNHEDSTREELFTDPEEIVTFAQAYYATEFPNDARRDCPPAEFLRAAALAVSLPDVGLRAHLFRCSECFRLYRSVRMSHHPQAAAGQSPGRRLSTVLAGLTLRPAPMAVAASCLVFLVAGAAALWWRAIDHAPPVAVNYSRQEYPPPVMLSTPQAGSAGTTDATKLSARQPERALSTRITQAQRPKKEREKRRTQPALRIVEISLKEDDLQRGDGIDKQRLINLMPERQRLRLRLPRGSVSGRYTVRIVDAFGKTLVTKAANSDGKTLRVELDLSTLTKNKYRLCLGRDGEAPDCYLVSVNGQ